MKISPLAPDSFATLPEVAGVKLATHPCNIRYKNRDDVLLVELAKGTKAAGVFTQSRVVAAPVTWCINTLRRGTARALVVNAGNANAFTGKKGMQSVKRVAHAAADALTCKAQEVCVASTGVIGEPLNDEKIIQAMPVLKQELSCGAWANGARAIMTTDTFMKVATRTATIGKIRVTVNGIAKGSGMIAPNMATLLAFVFTDANIPAAILRKLLHESNERSFNSITVDGDASTNDTLMVFATGQAQHKPVKSVKDAQLLGFKKAFDEVLLDLAKQVVRDGEGAQKLITITVRGAKNEKAARAIAFTIANSPLVKTAIAGEDANWGRIVAAAGRAGEYLVQEKMKVMIGGVLVAKNGARVEGYDESPVVCHMKGRDIVIVVDLGVGKGAATVYTCDLTHGYIDINGSYRS